MRAKTENSVTASGVSHSQATIVKRIKLSDVKLAEYNPKARSDPRGSPRHLSKSIAKVGLLYPILVARNNDLIDGHRRIAAAKILGWDDIPALVAAVESREEAYAEVNNNAEMFSGNDVLNIWLKNPLAVSKTVVRKMERSEEVIGRTMMVRIAKKGMSLRIFTLALSITKYVGQDEDVRFTRRTVSWLMKHRNVGIVREYLLAKQPAKTLFTSIVADRSIKVSYESA